MKASDCMYTVRKAFYHYTWSICNSYGTCIATIRGGSGPTYNCPVVVELQSGRHSSAQLMEFARHCDEKNVELGFEHKD